MPQLLIASVCRGGDVGCSLASSLDLRRVGSKCRQNTNIDDWVERSPCWCCCPLISRPYLMITRLLSGEAAHGWDGIATGDCRA
ncbi:hypothetical protein [Vreelandella alkaliphila]|uniref:Uncharacterized protein n=1 Tax=Vreelandella alkaliphila TaxID=272774 RepID=A0A7C9JUY5_9GAMM|nr:hypothetical protein [Halomonas alkaliphila]NDL72264.1 hypothetical protein [Halomonas alkaliphila]